MTRLACSLLLLTGGLASLHPETPAVPTVVQPVKHRPSPVRVSRSMLRLPHRASKPGMAKARTPGHRPDPPVLIRSPRSADLRTAAALNVTAYCATGNRNAAGNWPTIGTAAANAYPLGTKLHVESVGVVTVEDRSAPGATDVDIYMGDGADCTAAAVSFGRRVLRVWQVAA